MTKRMMNTVGMLLVGVMLAFGCTKDEPTSDQSIIGLDDTEVTSLLGAPTSDTELEIKQGDKLLEYQSSLSTALPKSGSLTTRELTWKNDKKTTKVWLKKEGPKWKAFDTLEWSKNVRF